MKEVRRYKLVATESNSKNVIKCDDGYWVHYSDVEQFQARIKELESAERTLINLGYENKGGELWKPPLGKKPDFSLIDSLNEKIKELESEQYINKIKAQGIEEAISNIKPTYQVDYTPSDMMRTINKALRVYAKKLRTNHE